MFIESLLIANLAMLSVIAYRVQGATRAELRLKELELDAQLGIGPVEEDCKALEDKKTSSHIQTLNECGRLLSAVKNVPMGPWLWCGEHTQTKHWCWWPEQATWMWQGNLRPGDVFVPGHLPRPTTALVWASLKKTSDISWLKGV